MFGVLYGVLIFVGFETAANLAEETAEPKRSIPRAVLFTVVIATIFYLIASYAQIVGFGLDASVITDPAVAAAPLFALGSPPAVGGYGSDGILKLLEVVVFLDILAVGLGAAVASARGVFAMARDRRIPGALARCLRSRARPSAAIVFVEVVSLVMVAIAQFSETVFADASARAALLRHVRVAFHVRRLRVDDRVRPDGDRRRSAACAEARTTWAS